MEEMGCDRYSRSYGDWFQYGWFCVELTKAAERKGIPFMFFKVFLSGGISLPKPPPIQNKICYI